MKIVKGLEMNTKLKSTARVALFSLISMSSAFGSDRIIEGKFQILDDKMMQEFVYVKNEINQVKNQNIILSRKNEFLELKMNNIEEENKKLKRDNALKIKRSNEELIGLIKKRVENSFNPKIYLTLYPDVKTCSYRKQRPTTETDDEYATWHFCEHTLPYDFAPEIYIGLYPGIKKDAEEAKMELNKYAIHHFITFKNSYKW